nr:uncharacterized protein LOC131768864 [Pocillopora verrucosa]
MLAAQEQVKSNPAYAVNGECVITDARHDSSQSAAHTTVSALSFSTKKVLAVVNWSKANETSAVSREVPMTKELLTYLCETQGAKSVTKAMKKVASGPQRDEGSKWFFELSDKVKSTRTHVYFCMKNSPPTEEEFQGTLLNVVDHYQGHHVRCHAPHNAAFVPETRSLPKPLTELFNDKNLENDFQDLLQKSKKTSDELALSAEEAENIKELMRGQSNSKV